MDSYQVQRDRTSPTVERSKVENAYGVLNRALHLPAKPPEPAAYLPRLVAALDLPATVERRA